MHISLMRVGRGIGSGDGEGEGGGWWCMAAGRCSAVTNVMDGRGCDCGVGDLCRVLSDAGTLIDLLDGTSVR